jgi:hypothetical protein
MIAAAASGEVGLNELNGWREMKERIEIWIVD